MRVILISNAGWAPSGYGTQIASLIPRLKDAGHDVAVSAFFGLQGGQIEWRGIKHYPCGLQAYGNDVIPLHFRDFKADIAVTLIDVWVLRPDIHKLIRFCPWTPIDHQPVPGPVLERLRNAWAILSYSKYAMRELEKVGLKSHYIPHGVEVDTFKPLPDRAALRAKFGIKEDAFVVGMVAANQSGLPSRKGYERIMPAIANLRRQGRDDLYLYIHTNPTRDMKGVPLLEMAKVFGVDDCTYFPRPDTFLMGGVSREELAELYNCFDILAMPSTAEGFGLPAVEAQACGVPVIATDFTAMTELCNSGWLIQPLTLLLTPLMSFQALPDIQSIEKRIAYAYEHPGEVKAKGEQAHEFAQQYSWDRIVEDCWLPTLDVLADRIEAESGRGLVPVVKDFRPPSVEVEAIIEPDIPDIPDVSTEDKEEQDGDS